MNTDFLYMMIYERGEYSDTVLVCVVSKEFWARTGFIPDSNEKGYTLPENWIESMDSTFSLSYPFLLELLKRDPETENTWDKDITSDEYEFLVEYAHKAFKDAGYTYAEWNDHPNRNGD